MSDNFTQLNPGAGGDKMDEEGVDFSGETRKRPRVVIGGDQAGDVIRPVAAIPSANAYALPVRQVGTLPLTGDVLNGAANTDVVVQIGGNASTPSSPPAAVDQGDRVRGWLDKSGTFMTRTRRHRESYTAYYRLAETGARLDVNFTHVANTTRQYATLFKTNSSTRDAYILEATLWILSCSVATQGIWELRALSGAPTVGTGFAVAPRPHSLSASATQCTACVLPGTGGTDVSPNSPYGGIAADLGVTGAASAVNPVVMPTEIKLWTPADQEISPIVLKAGGNEGVAIVGRTVVTPVIRFVARIRYAEETP